MKLKLLDINKFIQKVNAQAIENTELPSPKSGYVKSSLFGENIFGSITSRERFAKFGYINLNQKVFHPAVFPIIKSFSDTFSKIINKRAEYVFLEQEKIFKQVAGGENGVEFLIKNFEKIDLKKVINKDREKELEFLKKNKKLILIDKYLVIPAGFREIDISRFSTVRVTSEVNSLYSTLFYLSRQTHSPIITEKIQNSIIQIYDWFKNDLKGKNGLLRGKMLKKSLDFSSRLVLVSSPEIDLGEIGLPWHVLMAIYKPLFIHHIHHKNPKLQNIIQKFLDKDHIDYNDTDRLITEIHRNPNTFPDELKNNIIKSLREIIKDQVVICKRDPVLDRSSWFAAEPIITKGTTAIVNSLDLNPIGGDCDGDTIEILPLFSEEAKKVAKEKMNPKHSKTKMFNVANYDTPTYKFTLDQISTIYSATK